MNNIRSHIIIPIATVFLSMWLMSGAVIAQCNLYDLDWKAGQSKTSQYEVTCGSVSGSHWTVENNTCQLTTSPINLGGTTGDLVSTPIKMEYIAQGNVAGCNDYITIQYKIDNGDWVTQYSINSCAGGGITNGVHTYEFSVDCANTSAIAVRVVMAVYGSSGGAGNPERLRIQDGGICVGSSILPIALFAFNGTVVNGQVRLQWITASEKNNSHFIVERSTDGIYYTPIGTLQGAGDSQNKITYEFIDQDPPYGTLYYRLKQIDYDGKHTYSHVIAVDFLKRAGSFYIYPNPASGDKFYIDVGTYMNEEILVVLYDQMGQEVFSKVLLIEEGGTLIAIDLKQRLSPGVYLVVGASQDKLYHKKLVIK